ncbi:MAG TPA: hypothetical protein PLZ36_05795 [Armatimonadota bacterium]|nr:hypothetical protein [Armatimonadota bacterium]HOS42706.1 hypothetical protein [Armatimonadota bacterium]
MNESHEQDHATPPEPLVPPTPVAPEAYAPKPERHGGVGVGVVIGMMMDVIVIVLLTQDSFLAGFGMIGTLGILYAIAIIIAYRAGAPLVARGLFIMLGITIGVPLLAFGVCMALVQLA